MANNDPKTLIINDNDNDTTKGMKAGALFGHAVASGVDEVGNGAAQIISVAGHTVFSAAGKLLGAVTGGVVQGTKAMVGQGDLDEDELERRHALKMKRLELKERERTLKAQAKARRQQIANQRKLNKLLAKAQQVAAVVEVKDDEE